MITNNPEFLHKVILSMANEKYKEEIILTDMEELSIGPGKDWDSKADWISDYIVQHFNEAKISIIDSYKIKQDSQIVNKEMTTAMRLYSLDVGQEFEFDNFMKVIRVPGGWMFKRGALDLVFVPYSDEFRIDGGILRKEFDRINVEAYSYEK